MASDLTLDEKDKKFLLSLARKSILHYLSSGMMLHLSPSEVPSKRLVENRASFVTLRKGKELRGCIGTLEAYRPLFIDVINNAVASAVEDPRFLPLTIQELRQVKISISVLTEPKELSVKSPEELLEKLIPNKHGLILQQGVARATFLPSVWKELQDKNEFLRHLSIKAGLGPNGWRRPGTRFFIYETIEFSE